MIKKIMPTIIRLQPNEQYKNLSERILSEILKDLFSDKRVLVKPNWVNHLPPSSGATVDPFFIKEIVNQIKRLGAKEVAVGEASIINTETAFRALKVLDILKDTASIINFSKETEWIDVPINTQRIRHLRIPKIISTFDTIVSFAKLKTHCKTRISFTVKNLFGLLSQASRQAAHKVDLEASIAGLYLYLRDRMNIVGILDGLIAMEGRNGPLKGTPVSLNLVIAGDKASDVDFAGCLAINCAPSTIKHLIEIENATKEKFNKSTIKGYAGTFPIRQFKLPPIGGWHGPLDLSPIFKFLFKKKPVWQYKDKCTLCGDCVKICPTGSVKKDGDNIVIDKGKCVECLCCAEVCSFGAMTYTVRLGRMHAILKKVHQSINMR